jgi:tetratricopeptide (TPR) repeat protein
MALPGVLHVIGGHDRGKRFELHLPETHIGRGTDQDVVLSDIAVSRRHVTVLSESGRFRIKDLGSGNGTLVNGQRVETKILVDGDHIEIGQTVMRFEHAASRSAAASGGQPAYQSPPVSRTMPPAPSAQQPAGFPNPAPFGMPTPSMGASETPSDAMIVPPSPPMARAMPGTTGQRIGLPFDFQLDTPRKRLIVFGAMGAISLICLIVIFSRTVFAKPAVVPSDAEELYKQGLRLFGSGDYEGAKISFGEVVTQVPDSPEAKRYQKMCDAEVKARASIKAAEKSIAGHRFADGVKTLDEVDASSVSYDQAQKLRRENLPKAAAEDLDEAKKHASDDPELARQKLGQVLELDPNNEDARQLLARLKSGGPVAMAAPPKEPEPAPEEKEPPPRQKPQPVHQPAHSAKPSRDNDSDLAPVHASSTSKGAKEVKEVKEPPPSGGNAPMPANAMAAYKAKDFAGAEKALRMQAMSMEGKNAQKALDTANQVRALKTAVDRAGTEEGTKPDLAIRDYEDAMGIDSKVGHGMHAAFFKGKLGKLQLGYAQQAFGAGKYDVAFSAAKEAQRSGVDAGAIVKQLDLKAADLVQKGQGMMKTNIAQAKNNYRMVLKMVAPGTPNYTKAYQLLNSASGAHRDEDED